MTGGYSSRHNCMYVVVAVAAEMDSNPGRRMYFNFSLVQTFFESSIWAGLSTIDLVPNLLSFRQLVP